MLCVLFYPSVHRAATVWGIKHILTGLSEAVQCIMLQRRVVEQLWFVVQVAGRCWFAWCGVYIVCMYGAGGLHVKTNLSDPPGM